jgi:UrcA family protein
VFPVLRRQDARLTNKEHIQMKTSIKLLLPIVAVTLSGFASATAPIRVTTDTRSVVVKYDAASLATKAGVTSLHRRLYGAARSVCIGHDTGSLFMRSEYDQCVRDAVRRSVDDVANVNLTNYYRFRTLPSVLAAN